MFDKDKFMDFNKQRERAFKDTLSKTILKVQPYISSLDLEYIIVAANLYRINSENELLKEINRMREE